MADMKYTNDDILTPLPSGIYLWREETIWKFEIIADRLSFEWGMKIEYSFKINRFD